MSQDVYIIGIAGGSGSGKTTFARELAQRLPREHCALLFQDSYYIDQSARFDFDGGSVNFDHPDALDFPLLADHLRELKAGRGVQVPLYDFATHARLQTTLPQPPKRIILVDGILIFHPSEVRSLFDELIFFETPESLRYERRLKRDVQERGRTPEGVKSQFERQVKPMHDQFVEPSRKHAGIVVRDLEEYGSVLDALTAKYLRSLGL
jgi:uridine kinase